MTDESQYSVEGHPSKFILEMIKLSEKNPVIRVTVIVVKKEMMVTDNKTASH